ncbi:unnamed protein product [Parascedosporium putredinis]|uniref:Peroxin 8 n=1 Tax=Parascedosporium putredinis TaxID=1442378 RepID=A0A9P1MDK7_9PEZI|nr:unnamed protein product [Parascedosporium putredinis]CAI8000799.1 unnamed protein product [Parascedosporium putredinis]
MPADHLLNTVLDLFQTVHDTHKTDQIIGTTVTLLTSLSNPLNLAVLTSQLLTAPAIWHRGDGIQTSYRIISVFHTAAVRLRQSEGESEGQLLLPSGRVPTRLDCDAWATAVVSGADDRSNRWQHLLVFTGLLMGMTRAQETTRGLSWALRTKLEEAIVKAANLALERPMQDGPVAAASISVALGFALPMLSEFHLNAINSNALLPNAVWTLTGSEGFQEGRFLEMINSGLSRQGAIIHWPATSASFRHVQQLTASPVVTGMGSTAKLIMHSMQHAQDSGVVLQALDTLLEFSRELLSRWQRCQLSEVEVKTEGYHFSDETIQATWPALWDLLKKSLFATIAASQALMSRCLLDPRLRNDQTAPVAYTFTYLTAIDVLSRSPPATIALLGEIRPDADGIIPTHPVHRTLDLFYLGLAEHLPLGISTDASDLLIAQPATVYLSQVPDSFLMRELFESAHSAVLSVLSYPQNSPLATKLVPFYVDRLFTSFPTHISPRQFRVAFRTITQIVSPPFPVADTSPELAEVLLEMLRFRAVHAATVPLPPATDANPNLAAGAKPEAGPFSEQSTLLLALVDSLPFLALPIMDDWLTLTAETVAQIADRELRLPVRNRLWEVLESGELDVGRSSLALSWWYSRGGRELMLRAAGPPQAPAYVMSGALAADTTKVEGGDQPRL